MSSLYSGQLSSGTARADKVQSSKPESRLRVGAYQAGGLGPESLGQDATGFIGVDRRRQVLAEHQVVVREPIRRRRPGYVIRRNRSVARGGSQRERGQ